MLPDLRLKTINVSSFSPFGILKAVNLDIDPLTGRHKGYAYVEYDLPEGSQARIYFYLQSIIDSQLTNATPGGSQQG